MTVREVAAYLNVSEKTVYRLVQRRELRIHRVPPRVGLEQLA